MKDQEIIKTNGQSNLQTLTETKKAFVPSKWQLRWFQAAIELGYTATISDVSKKAKVSRESWYNWIANIEFVKWWDQQWKKYLNLSRWKLDAIGLKKAQNDYSFWKTMQERTGNIQVQPTTPYIAAQFNNQNVTKVTDLNDTQLDDIIA